MKIVVIFRGHFDIVRFSKLVLLVDYSVTSFVFKHYMTLATHWHLNMCVPMEMTPSNKNENLRHDCNQAIQEFQVLLHILHLLEGTV